MVPLMLAGAALAGYAGALWWLLRREAPNTLLTLVIICLGSLLLRLVYTGDFPAGFNGDEIAKLTGGALALKTGKVLVEDASGWPALPHALFQAPLIPLLGPRWAMRTYSLVASVLCTPLAFALARAVGLGVTSSLFGGALIAFLPWSIFYGRVSCGGELVFLQLLLLAALARLIWQAGDWRDVAIGALGLCGLLYDYGCGRTMLVMPLVAAVLARGWRRAGCVAVLAVALLGWTPYMLRSFSTIVLGFTTHVRPEAYGNPLSVWGLGMIGALRVFVAPVAQDAWLTVRGAAVHPPIILAMAALGALLPDRLSLFLWAGFLAGVSPVALTDNSAPSAHRMLMCFVFVVVAAARAIQVVRWRGARAAIAALIVALASAQSVAWYFSPMFWNEISREKFNPEASALVEALPFPTELQLIVTRQFGLDLVPRALLDDRYMFLDAQNWLPPDKGGVMYAFTAEAAKLRPFYENLAGAERVQAFGRAFLVTLDRSEWSWVGQHGWAYEASCGPSRWRRQVPTLYHVHLVPGDAACGNQMVHTWRGRWNGPDTLARLRFSGEAVVDVAGRRVARGKGFETSVEFVIPAGAEVSVRISTGPGNGAVDAGLVEITPAGERVPVWERVTPDWERLACVAEPTMSATEEGHP